MAGRPAAGDDACATWPRPSAKYRMAERRGQWTKVAETRAVQAAF
jgi:hypothetical protein